MCVTEQLHGPDGQRGICVFNELYFYDSLNCYIEVKQIRP